MDSVVPTGTVKKSKRQQVLPTVRPLPETRDSILARAKDILGPTNGQADPQLTQQFGQSALACRNAKRERPALLDVNRSTEEPPSTQPFGASSLRRGITAERSGDGCEEPAWLQFGASSFARQCAVLSNERVSVFFRVCLTLSCGAHLMSSSQAQAVCITASSGGQQLQDREATCDTHPHFRRSNLAMGDISVLLWLPCRPLDRHRQSVATHFNPIYHITPFRVTRRVVNVLYKYTECCKGLIDSSFSDYPFHALPMTSKQQPANIRDTHLSSVSESGDSGVDGTPGKSRGEKGSDCDVHAAHVESDTSTNTSDEFDWDEEPSDLEETRRSKHARRGRALWLACMKLTRPVRTLLVAVIGTAFFITPLLVVELKYKSSGVRSQVYAWSLWLSIMWAASCVTYLVVDLLPDTIVTIILLLGGQVERLKTQVEVCHHLGHLFNVLFSDHDILKLTLAVSAWLKLLLDVSWAWIALSVIRAYHHPPGSYWVIINRVLQVFLITCRPVRSPHVIPTGSFYCRRDPFRGKALSEIRCNQLPPACAR